MIKRIRNLFQTEYEKTLIKKNKKTDLSDAAGKLLIIFFAVMFIFTFVSRAASSFTVARVSVSSPKRDKLAYSMSGMGEIVPVKEEQVTVIPGYRIESVYVKAGEEIDKETALFKYSMDDLQDKYDSIAKEIEKIKLLISQEKLRQPITPDNKPSQAALLSLKQAEENLEIANIRLEEAKKDYEDSITMTKEKLIESKNKEYNTMLKNQEELVYSHEKQLKLYQRTVDDALAALEKANESKVLTSSLIDTYKTAVLSEDKGNIYRAQEAVFEAFYGSAENYEEHKEAIFNTTLSVLNNEHYLWILQNNIINYHDLLGEAYSDLQNALTSTDTSVNSVQNINILKERYNNTLNSYFYYLEEYERQVDLAEVVIEIGGSEFKKLRRNDKKLNGYLNELRESIISNADYKEQSKQLYDFLLGDRAKEIEKDIEAKTLVLTRSREDYELLENEFRIKQADLQTDINELKNIIISIEDGTYDFMDALEGKRQSVKAAAETVRIAKQVVEMNSLPYDTNNNIENDKRSKQISELVLQGYTIDLVDKEKELDEVGRLVENSGIVLSQKEGIVIFVGLEAGRVATGSELIKLGVGDYVFRAAFDKDGSVIMGQGSIIEVTLADKKTKLRIEVEKVTINDYGMPELMARLPGKEYSLGDRAEYKVTTQSEQFNQCIPIQALREDNLGHYVLVIREQEDILGIELVAERIPVTILDKSNETVAVDGPLSQKSQVITDSSKYVNNGDKVRIN